MRILHNLEEADLHRQCSYIQGGKDVEAFISKVFTFGNSRNDYFVTISKVIF